MDGLDGPADRKLHSLGVHRSTNGLNSFSRQLALLISRLMSFIDRLMPLINESMTNLGCLILLVAFCATNLVLVFRPRMIIAGAV